MPRAILSVYDKTGLEELAHGLSDMGWDLVASGGTARALEMAGIAIVPVERVTQHRRCWPDVLRPSPGYSRSDPGARY